MFRRKFSLKSFTKGMVIGILIMITMPVLATELSAVINVNLNRMKVYVDGVFITEDTILYNGVTYMPIRQVARSIGLPISWDPANPKEVHITSESVQPMKRVERIEATFHHTMTVGETQKVIVNCFPSNALNKDVKFESSDLTIAIVDRDGYLTAKKAGTAFLYIDSIDGGESIRKEILVKEKSLVDSTYPITREFFGRTAIHIGDNIYKIKYNGSPIIGTIPQGWIADTDTQGTISAGKTFSCGEMTLRPAK